MRPFLQIIAKERDKLERFTLFRRELGDGCDNPATISQTILLEDDFDCSGDHPAYGRHRHVEASHQDH